MQHPSRQGAQGYSIAKKPEQWQRNGRGWAVAPQLSACQEKLSQREEGLSDPGVSPEAPKQMVKGPLFDEVGC